MDRQQTTARNASCTGIGVHSGEPATLTLRPAPEDSGIVFIRTDVQDRDNAVRAHALNVSTTQLGTNIANEAGVSIATVEHFLAACAGLELDNVVAELDGPELPIVDGSSAPFVELIERAGLSRQAGSRKRIRVLRQVEIRDGQKFARLSPGEGFRIEATIDFPARVIGRQSLSFRMHPTAFRDEIAWARTFGFAHEIEMLQARGLARGGSLDNAIVIKGDAVLNEGGVRAGEFVRHKIIDVIGDLYLAGSPIEGVYEAEQPGHALNNRLLRAMFADSSSFEVVEAA